MVQNENASVQGESIPPATEVSIHDITRCSESTHEAAESLPSKQAKKPRKENVQQKRRGEPHGWYNDKELYKRMLSTAENSRTFQKRNPAEPNRTKTANSDCVIDSINGVTLDADKAMKINVKIF